MSIEFSKDFFFVQTLLQEFLLNWVHVNRKCKIIFLGKIICKVLSYQDVNSHDHLLKSHLAVSFFW